MSESYQQATITLKDFRFESGQVLPSVDLFFESWGELNAQKDNVILVTHALTGNTHINNNGTAGDNGWWEFLVGPGKPFDTRRYFVICINVPGSCSGSSGPATIDPQTAKPYGMRFPLVTIRDMVNTQKAVLDILGVCKIQAICGASMGGMQAMDWAVAYPEMVGSIISIAAPGRVYPQSIAFRKAQRKAIMLDPNWQNGDYYEGNYPVDGVETARMIGFISYRSEQEWRERFGRNTADDDMLRIESRFEIESYLEYHGKKLTERFDANSYIYLSKSMDLHDLGQGQSSYETGVQRIQCPVLMIGFDSDLLFPCYQQREVVDILQDVNSHAYYSEIQTIYGHDAFLIEEAAIASAINTFFKDVSFTQNSEEYSHVSYRDPANLAG